MVASLITTTLAGTIASCVESSVTYPLDYLKTRQQLAVRPTNFAASQPPFRIPHLTSVLYQGWSPLVLGNALKTWVRFNTFNAATKFMSTDARTGQSSDRATAPVVIASGVFTGIAETLVVVPFESIKTSMVEASSVGVGQAVGALLPVGALNSGGTTYGGKRGAQLPQNTADPAKISADPPKTSGKVRPVPVNLAPAHLAPVSGPQSMVRTVRDMYRFRGLRAFVQGFNPTVLRQVANSAVRFTAWNMWMQMVALDGEDRMSWLNVLVGSGVAAGAEAVVTQPLDVIKTRMQTANARKVYGNALLCAYRVFVEEGWRQLWAGLAPRWARKWVSGGILWAVYETSFKAIDRKMNEVPFN